MNDIDIDAHNIAVSAAFAKRLLSVNLTSEQRKLNMLKFGNRTNSSHIGLAGTVQLCESPAIFVEQSKHLALLRAVCKQGVAVVAPQYERFDAETGLGAAGSVPFCLVPATLDGLRLHAALVDAGVASFRVVEYNGKTPAATWIAAYADYIMPNSTSIVDISTTATAIDAHIPLVGVERAQRCKTRVWPLLGELGDGCGTTFLYGTRLVDGVRIEQTCVYAGGLVHWAKSHGLKRFTPSNIVSVQSARNTRIQLVDKALLMTQPNEINSAPLGQLRIEARSVVDHAKYRGDWAAAIQLVAMRDLDDVAARYHNRVTLRGIAVPIANYVAGVHEMVRLVNDAKYMIGFGTGSSKSIVAVGYRIGDLLNQLGYLVGWHWLSMLCKKATWSIADPSKDEIYESERLWENEPFVELPALPRARVAVVARRQPVLVIGNRNAAKRKAADERADAQAALDAERAAERKAKRAAVFGIEAEEDESYADGADDDELPPHSMSTRLLSRFSREQIAKAFAMPVPAQPRF